MNSERHHKQSRKKVRMRLLWFIGFILISLYLWGTVQIDFDLRQNDNLKQEIESLQNETNDLRIQVNALASYQRIVALASERGLVFLSANHKKELAVDWMDQEISLEQEEAQIQYAGFF
ncbi:hypothetical protein JW824_06805 [bacterium]|nr:hypothetical protein [bacterium]